MIFFPLFARNFLSHYVPCLLTNDEITTAHLLHAIIQYTEDMKYVQTLNS